VEFGGFGCQTYAYEELVAETISIYVASDVGVSNDAVLANHASYLQSWSDKIKEDPKALFKAFAEAEQGADWVMQRHPVQMEARAAQHQANELALQQGMTVGTPTAGVDYTEGLFDQQPKPAQQGAGMSM
jgi:antirestriction protein ArdC